MQHHALAVKLDVPHKSVGPGIVRMKADGQREWVEPHCAALESCAAAMEAAGVGTHPSMGHVHVLRRMSDGMRAEAAMGKVPHIWRDHDYPLSASADKANGEDDVTKDEITKLIAEAVGAIAA